MKAPSDGLLGPKAVPKWIDREYKQGNPEKIPNIT